MIWTPGISGNRCTKTSKTWPRIQQSITWTTFIYITTTQYNKFFYEIFVSPLQMFARRCCEILHKCLLFLYTMGSEPSDGANWQRRQGWRRMQTTQRSPPYIHDFNESFCFWSDIRRNRNGNKKDDNQGTKLRLLFHILLTWIISIVRPFQEAWRKKLTTPFAIYLSSFVTSSPLLRILWCMNLSMNQIRQCRACWTVSSKNTSSLKKKMVNISLLK